jgi:hypothetical protein
VISIVNSDPNKRIVPKENYAKQDTRTIFLSIAWGQTVQRRGIFYIVSALIFSSTFNVGLLPAFSADLPTKAVAYPAPPQPQNGWTFEFSPYLWAAGLKGNVDLGPLAPPVRVDVGFDQVLEHLHMTFMGTFEARYGKLGLIADTAYLSEKVSATGPLGFVNGNLDDKTFFGTFAAAYRIFDQPKSWVDVVAGARVWWRSDTLDITAPGPASLSVSRDQSWVDPIVGIRARAYVTPEFYLQFYGDIGGFGVAAKSDWQVAGLIGYQYNPSATFFAGYRYLSVDYNRNNYLFDLNLSGPIFGVTFKL